MSPALDTTSATDNIASITGRSSRLSHTLFDISFGLVKSPVTATISIIAGEFAELSSLAQETSRLLDGGESVCLKEGREDVGKAFNHLDTLVKYFEDAIADSGKKRVPKEVRDLFKESNITDLTWQCHSVKKALQLQKSLLNISICERRRQRTKKKKDFDITLLTRELEFAESWVEASRQVIRALLDAERRINKCPARDVLQPRYPEMSCGKAALWLYDMVFSGALKATPASERVKAKGRVKTVRTTDGNATASDSEHSDKVTNEITQELERELFVTTKIRRNVVNDLLARWTGYDWGPIRQVTDSVRDKNITYSRRVVMNIIRRGMGDDLATSKYEDAGPTPKDREGRVGGDGEKHEPEDTADQAGRIIGPAETPPILPRELPHENHDAENGGREKEDYSDELYVYPSPPPRRPSATKVSFRSRASSPQAPITIGPSSDYLLRPAPDGSRKGDNRFMFVNKNLSSAQDRHAASTRPPALKDTTVDNGSRASQSSRRVIAQYSSSKPGIDSHRPPRPKEEDDDIRKKSTSSNHRSRSMPVHESICDTDALPLRHPRDDPRTNNGYLQPTSLNPRRPQTSDPSILQVQAPNMFNMSGIGGPYYIQDYAYPIRQPPGPGFGGLFPPHPPPLRPDGYIPSYAEQVSVKDDPSVAKMQDMQEMQRRVGELEKTEKARTEEAKKEEERRKAKEEEKRLVAQKTEIEELKAELLEQERRNAARWEEEKLAIEISLNERQLTEGQAHKHAEDQSLYLKEEIDKLHLIIKKLMDNEHRKAQEWEDERRRLTQAAEEKLQDSAERMKEAWDEAAECYDKQLEEEKENVRKANHRAEHYVEEYNKLARTAPDGLPTMPDSKVNPLLYLDEDERSSSRSIEEKSAMEATQMGSPVEPNPWLDRERSPQYVQQDRTIRYTVSAASISSHEASNVILFPPRAGTSGVGPNQLGNYLSSSGFKAMFEVREPNGDGRYEKIGSGGNVLRGTLFWQPPASTAEAELYRSLRNAGWRPTYVRTTASGQTWFFGPQPVHAQFFGDMYKPQIGPFDFSRAGHGSEKENLIISDDFVEIEELDFLGHTYQVQDGKIFLDPTLTAEDIDHIVARSFLTREGRYRKKFRNSRLRYPGPHQTKQDIFEVASEAGESESSYSSSATKDTRLSLWSFWGPWTSSR